MSDFVWYSRTVLWVGAFALLVEAVTGRSEAVITVIATICLAGGFVGFLIGLAVSGRDTTQEDGALPAQPAGETVHTPLGGPSKP